MSRAEAASWAARHDLRLDGDLVQVALTIDGKSTAAVRTRIAAAGGHVTGQAAAGTRLQAWLPTTQLERIAAGAGVRQVARPALATTLQGAVTTQGVASSDAASWHAVGKKGAGTKIGIIDGGFVGYALLLGTELGAATAVKNFVDGETDAQVASTTQHGTACAEVVQDMAPDAQLSLAKIATDIDLAEAVDWLVNTQGVDIISTSLGWYGLTPGDGTGFFEDLVASARAAGVLWVTAAGNNQRDHWGGAFADSDADTFHNFAGVQEVNFFGPGDGTAYNIPSGSRLFVAMRWDDWTAVDQDFDLYLLRWNGSAWDYVGTPGENVQNGSPGQLPSEFAFAFASGTSTAYGYVIVKYAASRNVHLEVHAPNLPTDRRVAARSLANLADAPSAVTVGAVHVTSPYALEPYSSQGPTNGPGGIATGGARKPDLASYANVATIAYGGSFFNGTSAATPHVAGAAALVLGANPSYTPSNLEAVLVQRAADLGSTGADNAYGSGRLLLKTPTDLAASVVDSPDPVSVGNHLAYTATIRNNGPQNALGTVIRLTLSPSVTFLSASAGCTNSGATTYGTKTIGGLVTCTVGTLASTASASRTVTVGVVNAGPISATANARGAIGDTNIANNVATTTTTATFRTGQTAKCTRLGTASSETLTGSSSSETICGFGGNDVILGNGGNDVVNGGPGIDRTSYGSAPAGVLVNLATATTACHPSTAACGQGADKLVFIEDIGGSAYADKLQGNNSPNKIYAGGGNDYLYAYSSDDYLDGGNGNDYLSGGYGNDRLYGQAGTDRLYGEDGNDTLDGGTGTDTCSQGTGTGSVTNCP